MATTIQDKQKRSIQSRNKLPNSRVAATSKPADSQIAADLCNETGGNTAITRCVKEELRRYFELLDGEEPSNVYQLVMRQTEHALIESVMKECGGNQSKATKWLGISRGNLRNKLSEMGCD